MPSAARFCILPDRNLRSLEGMVYARIALALILTSRLAFAQATVPTSRPTTRRSVVIPPGFERVEAASRIALCEKSDEPWVKQALQSAAPATRPTTMPSDLITRFGEKRDAILKGMSHDLGIDTTEIVTFFDEKLVPSLHQLDQLKPPLLYLVT